MGYTIPYMLSRDPELTVAGTIGLLADPSDPLESDTVIDEVNGRPATTFSRFAKYPFEIQTGSEETMDGTEFAYSKVSLVNAKQNEEFVLGFYEGTTYSEVTKQADLRYFAFKVGPHRPYEPPAPKHFFVAEKTKLGYDLLTLRGSLKKGVYAIGALTDGDEGAPLSALSPPVMCVLSVK